MVHFDGVHAVSYNSAGSERIFLLSLIKCVIFTRPAVYTNTSTIGRSREYVYEATA